MADLTKLTPPKDLSEPERQSIFDHVFRRLAGHYHAAELYALAEYSLSPLPEPAKAKIRDAYLEEIRVWGQALLDVTWIACQEPGGGKCPELDPLSDSSVGDLPHLPPQEVVCKILNTILFLHVTTTKQYSARTRSFLAQFGTTDESTVADTLKNPDAALKEAQKQVKMAKEEHAARGKILRRVGMGLGAVAGGVLVGVTGGLAAPLVGAGVAAVLGTLGVGGTAIGILASGLASSSVICGALFGVYGARSTANMVERHTREIRDLAVLPVHPPKETLAVCLCVSGWLSSPEDVTAPWTVLGGDDTFALQWEVEALEELSNALYTVIKTQAMRYVKAEIIKRTVLASLMMALSPIAWLQIGRVVDNPWMNAKALATKAGAVLADLVASRAFGNRPITLTGFSLGSLVIFEALRLLSELPPSKTVHLIEDVFLYGAPISPDPAVWSSVRRVVSGRLVNGYGKEDYILAVLSRASNASWAVAGLQPVDVHGVENIECEEVDGHIKWRGLIGRCLLLSEVPGVDEAEIGRQSKVAERIEKFMEMSEEEMEEALKSGPGGVEKTAPSNT
ncbi:DUF726-domain-containing protein [Dentipellis sp. KUC8613]|nr:DUF726-domain-containing protein [Dentipellis sp. KUC8613]